MKLRKDTPIVYLSGFFSQVKIGPNGKKMSLVQVMNYWRKKSGAVNRCYAFPYVGEDGFFYVKKMGEVYADALKNKDHIFMDSGAHTFHNFVRKQTGSITKKKAQYDESDIIRLRDETIRDYITFVKHESKKWDSYVNFDYVHDAEECFRMQEIMWKAGLEPTPVFHGEPGTLEYFKRYAEGGAKIIGLGTGGINDRRAWSKKRVYFDIMFNLAEKHGVKLHGFAVTSLSLLFQYPWYSCDSATWAKCSAYGKLIFPDLKRNTLNMIHVSDHSLSKGSSDCSYNKMPRDARKHFERVINDYGYDIDKLRTNLIERYCFNAAIYAQHISELKEVVKGTRVQWTSLPI